METAPGTAKQHRTTGAVAIRTKLGGARAWYVLDLENGGGYTADEPIGSDWVALSAAVTT